MSEKLLGFYELLKADKQIKVTEEVTDQRSAAEACGLAFKQPIIGRQYVPMTDASFRASGYALMIEEEKTQLKKENLRPSRIWFESFLTSSTKNVHLLQRIRGNLSCLPRIQSHPMGSNPTDPSDDRQQISNKIFSNKSDSTHTMERMRLRPTIQFPYQARSRNAKYCGRLPLKN